MNEVVHRAKIGGVDLAYLEDGLGTLVLLLHGFPDTARTWKRVQGYLADRNFRAVAVFQRGYFPSDIPADQDYSIRRLANDALEFIEHLGATKAVLIGHDWGALAAYAAAALAPEKIAAIITLAIAPIPLLEDSEEERTVRPHNIYLGRGEESVDMFQRNDLAEIDHLYALWSPHWLNTKEHLKGVKDAFRFEARARAAVDYYRMPLSEEDRTEFSVKLPMPALVVFGGDEPQVRKALFHKTPSAFSGPVTCTEYGAVGHWPHLEAPDRFEQDVIAFFEMHGIS